MTSTTAAEVNVYAARCSLENLALQPRQDDAALRLVLPFFVLVADFAIFVAHEEKHLAETFVGVDFCG